MRRPRPIWQEFVYVLLGGVLGVLGVAYANLVWEVVKLVSQ